MEEQGSAGAVEQPAVLADVGTGSSTSVPFAERFANSFLKTKLPPGPVLPDIHYRQGSQSARLPYDNIKGYTHFLEGYQCPTMRRGRKLKEAKDHYNYFAQVLCKQGSANVEDTMNRSHSRFVRSRCQQVPVSPRSAAAGKKKKGHTRQTFPPVRSSEAASNSDTTQDQGKAVTTNSNTDMDKLPPAINASSSSGGTVKQGSNVRDVIDAMTKHRESRREELSAAQLGAISMAIKQRRDACDSLRCLVFGLVGNEDWRRNEQHLLYEQRRGNKDEVLQLFKVWTQIDEDGSGDIEYHEFIDFFSKTKADRLLGMKCVKYLVGSGEEQLPHEEKRRGCTVEDMMRLIWLKAADEDVAFMLNIFKLAALHNKRLPTPKLLPKRKRNELLENFKWLDKENKGIISYNDLVDGGLMDEETADELMTKYDTDGSGDLDGEEFLEMLCPHGYRAHEGSKKVVDTDGNKITYVHNNDFTGWMFEDDAKSLQSFQDPFQELS